MITQKELVDKWGISKGRVSQLVAEGLPLDSFESAEAWRAQRIVPKEFAEEVQQGVAEATKQEAQHTDISRDDHLGRVARGRMAERVAFSFINKAVKAENPAAMRIAVRAWGDAKKRVAEAEAESKKIESISYNTAMAKAQISKVVSVIQPLLKQMPKQLGILVANKDAKEAEDIIQQAVEAIFKAVYEAV